MSGKAAAKGEGTRRDTVARELFQGELSPRHREVLEAAAALFAERGYAATSVRDIGERVGLLGGSLYHYIKSKEALFVRIHNTALEVSGDRIRVAVDACSDPWDRLEAACTTMLGIQLDPHSITMPLMNDLQAVPPEVREQLIVNRNAFEKIFIDLVADLPLDPRLDRGVYRLLLLTLLNNVSLWFREGRLTAQDIARQIVLIFRQGAAGATGAAAPAAATRKVRQGKAGRGAGAGRNADAGLKTPEAKTAGAKKSGAEKAEGKKADGKPETVPKLTAGKAKARTQRTI